MTEQQCDKTDEDDLFGGLDEAVTILTQDVPFASLKEKGYEKTVPRENCFNLQRQAVPHPATMTVEAYWPRKTTVNVGSGKIIQLDPNFGNPNCSSVTFDAMLARRGMAWPDLRWRVLMALAMQTRPMIYAKVTVHAEVDQEGDITLTEDAAERRCKTTIPSDPYRVRDASAENLLRLMQPHDWQVAHRMQLLVELGGFEVDPSVFKQDSRPAPTVEQILHELAALQSEGVLSKLAPDNSALLNPVLIFNGNPALRSLAQTAVRPADGDTFSVDPSHAVDPNQVAPNGHWKSGDRKRDAVKSLKRELAELRHELKATDKLNERQADKLNEERQANSMLIEQATTDAMVIEAANVKIKAFEDLFAEVQERWHDIINCDKPDDQKVGALSAVFSGDHDIEQQKTNKEAMG